MVIFGGAEAVTIIYFAVVAVPRAGEAAAAIFLK